MADKKKDRRGRGDISIIGDAILAETINKELRHFVLYDKYMLSPAAIKSLVVTSKPTDPPISDKSFTDPQAYFEEKKLRHFKHSNNDIPVTSSNQYGWDAEPLLRIIDQRFYHPKTVTEITKKYGTSIVKGPEPEKVKK